MRTICILLLLIGPASAAEFAVNDQDQTNIIQMCDTAAQSPSLSRQVRANVAMWCVAWQTRMEEAAKKAADEAKEHK